MFEMMRPRSRPSGQPPSQLRTSQHHFRFAASQSHESHDDYQRVNLTARSESSVSRGGPNV